MIHIALTLLIIFCSVACQGETNKEKTENADYRQPAKPLYVPTSYEKVMRELSPITCVEWTRFLKVSKSMGSDEEVSAREDGISKLYDQACAGNTRAQYVLANFHHSGCLVARDTDAAIYWMTKAANLGLGEAADQLAWWYESGHGVQKSLNNAVFWYEKSADLPSQIEGVDSTIHMVIDFETGQMSSRSLPGQGRQYRAKVKVGEAYFLGRGAAKDLYLAAKFFKQAAVAGNADAQAYLGQCYQNALGVEKDEIEAYAYWNLSSPLVKSSRDRVLLLDKTLPREIRIMAQQRTRELKEVIENNIQKIDEQKTILQKAIEEAKRKERENGA